MNKVRNILVSIGVLLLVAIIYFVLTVVTKKPQMSLDFTTGTSGGKVISLHDNIGKSGTVLIFIDPEVEGSMTVAKKVIDNNDGCDIIAVSVSELDEAEQKKLLTPEILALEKLCFDSAEIKQLYNVKNAPITYFIDKDGYVRDAFLADIKEETVKKSIRKIEEK